MTDQMQFTDKARAAFEFLRKDYGYRELPAAPRVVFESDVAQIEIVFDIGRSFELDVLVSLGGALAAASVEPPYTLGEVLAANDAPEADQFRCVQVTDPAVLERFLERMANLLRMYGRGLVEGEVAEFRKVARARDAACREYREEKELEQAVSAAASAWKAGRYQRVVDVLEPVADRLTRSDAKRLEIARKRVAAGP